MEIKTSKLESKFPLWKIEHDCIISKYGDITIGFKLSLPEIFSLTEDDLSSLHNRWCKAINLLPDYTVMHKQDWFMDEQYFSQPESSDYFEKANVQHFIGRKYYNHSSYLFLTKTSPNNMKKDILATSLCRRYIVPPETLDNKKMQDFILCTEQFSSLMREQGVHMERLEKNSLTELIEEYLSFSKDGVLKDMHFLAGQNMIGDKYFSVHTLSNVDDLPMSVHTHRKNDRYSSEKMPINESFVQPLALGLPCNHIYNQYIFIDNSEEKLQKLLSQRKKMTSLSKYSMANVVNAEAIDEYIGFAAKYNLRSVRAHQNVIAWANSAEELRIINTDIGTSLTKIGCAIRLATTDSGVLYFGGIPGAAADFPSDDTYDTFIEPAVCFINNETNYQNSLSPFGIKMTDRLTGCPIHLDISDLPMAEGIINNRNKFVLGPSGSGKSYFSNHMVRQYYEQGAHVMLIDMGNSYLPLCQYINQKTNGRDGIYITHSEEKPIAFNPFYTDSGNFPKSKKKMIKALLLILWKKASEEVKMYEDAELTKIIELFLEKVQKEQYTNPNFNTFYEFLGQYPKVLASKNAEKKLFAMVSDLLSVLELYYADNVLGYLLNSDKQLDFQDKRFVVFELDNIKDEEVLLPVITLIITDSFTQKLFMLPGKRKVIVIEEAWKAIARQAMAEYTLWLFKTVRKYFGEAIVVTQEIDDIIGNPIVKDAIINNSDCKILLDQSKYLNKFEIIENLLGLTSKESALALSINRHIDKKRGPYKEVFISLGGGKQLNVYGTEVSRSEHYLFTTEQKEKLRLFEAAEKKEGDIVRGIREIIES